MTDYGKCGELADELREHEDVRDMFTVVMKAKKTEKMARQNKPLAIKEFNKKYSETIGFVLQETGLPVDMVDDLEKQEEVRFAFDALADLSTRFTKLEKNDPDEAKLQLDDAMHLAIAGILFQAGSVLIARGEEVPDSIAMGPRPEGSVLMREKRDHIPPKGVRVEEGNNTVEYFQHDPLGDRLADRNKAKEAQEAIEKLQAQEGTQPARKKRGPPTPIPPEEQAEPIEDWPAAEAGPVKSTATKGRVKKQARIKKPMRKDLPSDTESDKETAPEKPADTESDKETAPEKPADTESDEEVTIVRVEQDNTVVVDLSLDDD